VRLGRSFSGGPATHICGRLSPGNALSVNGLPAGGWCVSGEIRSYLQVVKATYCSPDCLAGTPPGSTTSAVPSHVRFSGKLQAPPPTVYGFCTSTCTALVRFGVFDGRPRRPGELRRNGVRVRLQDLPLSHATDPVAGPVPDKSSTREEFRQATLAAQRLCGF